MKHMWRNYFPSDNVYVWSLFLFLYFELILKLKRQKKRPVGFVLQYFVEPLVFVCWVWSKSKSVCFESVPLARYDNLSFEFSAHPPPNPQSHSHIIKSPNLKEITYFFTWWAVLYLITQRKSLLVKLMFFLVHLCKDGSTVQRWVN